MHTFFKLTKMDNAMLRHKEISQNHKAKESASDKELIILFVPHLHQPAILAALWRLKLSHEPFKPEHMLQLITNIAFYKE
jgi:hypothetical protein